MTAQHEVRHISFAARLSSSVQPRIPEGWLSLQLGSCSLCDAVAYDSTLQSYRQDQMVHCYDRPLAVSLRKDAYSTSICEAWLIEDGIYKSVA